jgi:hypothetical protein
MLFDFQGVVHKQFVQEGKTVNAKFCRGEMDRFTHRCTLLAILTTVTVASMNSAIPDNGVTVLKNITAIFMKILVLFLIFFRPVVAVYCTAVDNMQCLLILMQVVFNPALVSLDLCEPSTLSLAFFKLSRILTSPFTYFVVRPSSQCHTHPLGFVFSFIFIYVYFRLGTP